MSKQRKVAKCTTLDQDVVKAVEKMAEKTDRTFSYVVNEILKKDIKKPRKV